MKFCLVQPNAKYFAKAVQFLSKFGTDLYVEIDETKLQLCAFNPTGSAFGTIPFFCGFFDTFSVSSNDGMSIKIAQKACLSTFNKIKDVEICEMEIQPEEKKLCVVFQNIKKESTRKSTITILDEEEVNISISLDGDQNVLSASHKVFSELAQNFNVVEEELTLRVNSRSITAKNFLDNEAVNYKFMRLEVELPGAAFDEYMIIKDGTITFCLKEFRALLNFAESLNEKISLQFSESGSPVSFTIRGGHEFEATLIMSTLADTDISIQEPIQNKSITRLNEKSNRKGLHRARTEEEIATDPTLDNDSALFQFTPRSDVDGFLPVLDENNPLAAAYNNKAQQQQAVVEEESDHDCITDSPTRPTRSVFQRCFQSTYIPSKPSPSSRAFVQDSDVDDDV